ncbi:MAG: membrane protein of unknown function [Promethearchaeota archaeon]|jgi:hypothetical protein|nr:MAG: membrane protein of unknown function [Candidatus Lokiarchaeota archaeon]
MILVSAYDYPEPIRTIMMISQITNGIGLFLIALFAFMYYRKEGFFENEQTKTYIVGIVLLFSILGIYRFFFFYHDFFAPDDISDILWRIGNIILLTGLTLLNFLLEKYVYKKTKYIFTIISLIISILYIAIFNKSMASILLNIGTFLMIIFPLIIHLIIAIRGSGWVRKNALLIVVGIIIISFSSFGLFLFETIGLLDTTTSRIFGHPIALIGYILLGYGLIVMLREK